MIHELRDASVLDVIARRTRETPETIAVKHASSQLTYAELIVRADRLAQRLQALGVSRERLVGICLPRSVEMVVAVMAVLRAGGAYLPLDPESTSDRIAAICVDATPLVVLTNRDLASSLLQGVDRICALDSDELDDVSESTEALIAPAADDLAYVIYTSGSTGRPKGVAVEHRNLLASTTARLAVYPEHVQAFLLLSPLAFDSSVAGLFWTLCSGGTVVLPPDRYWEDLGGLVGIIEREHVSHLLSVPSLHAAVLDAIEVAGVSPSSGPAVAIVAGERCPSTLPGRHREILPQCRLVNEYGPTEASVWATSFDATNFAGERVVPIGKAADHVQVHLVDNGMQPVNDGDTGEILIGGSGVARGYLKRERESAVSFIPDHLGDAPEGRLYRTADLARKNSDGDLEFIGRTDNQVKVRGHRVEPEEIEHVISNRPEVAAAAVVASGEDERVRLLAYVVFQPGVEAPSLDDLCRRLRDDIRTILPAYMVPASVISLPRLPVTTNGKVDRTALASAPTPTALRTRMPLRDAEGTVAQIWAEVLDITVSSIGADESFFELGGNSLLLLKMRRKVESAFERTLSVAELFAHPTVSTLASLLSAEETGASTAQRQTPSRRHNPARRSSTRRP